MSAAETLREAAALMRDRAQAATRADQWIALGERSSNVRAARLVEGRLTVQEGVAYRVDRQADAVHIAGMHPAVALALADLLDVCAEATLPDDDPDEGGLREPLILARAYLGGTP